MTANYINRTGFGQLVPASVSDNSGGLAMSLWTDLVSLGFSLVATDSLGLNSISNSTKAVCFTPPLSIDPLASTCPWYVAFRVLDTSFVSTLGSFVPVVGAAGSEATVSQYNAGVLISTTTFNNTQMDFAFFTPEQTTSSNFPNAWNASTDVSLIDWYPILPGFQLNRSSNNTAPSAVDEKRPRIWPGNPHGYVLSTSARGLALQVYPTNKTESFNFSGTVVAQRGVGATGAMATLGVTPIFMLTNVLPYSAGMSKQQITYNWQGVSTNAATSASIRLPGPHSLWFTKIIREADNTLMLPLSSSFGSNVNLNVSTMGVVDFDTIMFDQSGVDPTSLGGISFPPGAMTGQQFPVMNMTASDSLERNGNNIHKIPVNWGQNVPVTADTGEYLLIFPSGICSSRFAYSDELDLIAISKANAFQAGQQVTLSVYGESLDRTYTAMSSNVAEFGSASAIRVFFLTTGP